MLQAAVAPKVNRNRQNVEFALMLSRANLPEEEKRQNMLNVERQSQHFFRVSCLNYESVLPLMGPAFDGMNEDTPLEVAVGVMKAESPSGLIAVHLMGEVNRGSGDIIPEDGQILSAQSFESEVAQAGNKIMENVELVLHGFEAGSPVCIDREKPFVGVHVARNEDRYDKDLRKLSEKKVIKFLVGPDNKECTLELQVGARELEPAIGLEKICFPFLMIDAFRYRQNKCGLDDNGKEAARDWYDFQTQLITEQLKDSKRVCAYNSHDNTHERFMEIAEKWKGTRCDPAIMELLRQGPIAALIAASPKLA